MRVRRLPFRPLGDLGEAEFDAASEGCGSQLEWGQNTALAFQALWVPRPCAVMPAAPSPGADHYAAIAYWAPLMHLMAFSLGWTRPFQGLRWWYDAGQPTDDPRLALIADVWAADGQLDWFTLWLGGHDPDWRPWFDGVAEPGDNFVTHRPTSRADGWLAALRAASERSQSAEPLVGGSDPLHLGYHWAGPLQPSSQACTLVHGPPGAAAASFTAEVGQGWYRKLAEHGSTLPPIGERSWHVEVVVRSLGYLGTYRRSRRTGLWFAGKHRFHEKGQ